MKICLIHSLPHSILFKFFSFVYFTNYFGKNKGKGYDYLGILGQFFYAQKVQDDDRYFCSEFCLNAIDYALQFTLTYKLKSLKDRVGYEFNPHRLYKYLKNMELIDEKEVE